MSELARQSEVSQGGLSYLKKHGKPKASTLASLARALGIEPLWLATGRGPRKVRQPSVAVMDLAYRIHRLSPELQRLVEAVLAYSEGIEGQQGED